MPTPDSSTHRLVDVETGQPVYDADGNALGTVFGLDEGGFYVSARDDVERLTLARARDLLGRAYVTWRCRACGEIGELEGGLPETCPDCGAAREELYYRTED